MTKTIMVLLAVVMVGCGGSPSAPTMMTVETVNGTSIIVDSVSESACIVAQLEQAKRDPNTLTGTLTSTGLVLTDQFGESVQWSRDGARFTANPLPHDSISGVCGLRERVMSATMDLARHGNQLTGTRTNRYDLYTLDGVRTGQTVVDTEAVHLTIF